MAFVLLGSHGLLKDVTKNITITDWNGSLPYRWNKEKNRLVVKSYQKLFLYKVHLFMSILFIAFSFIQVVLTWKKATLLVKTHSILFLTAGIINSATHLVNIKELKRVVALFNSFIAFEEARQQAMNFNTSANKRDLGFLLSKHLMLSMLATGVFMPIIYHLDILRNPCFPVYVGFVFSDQCQLENLGDSLSPTWSTSEVAVKVGMSLFSYYVWSFILIGFCFHVSIEMILHGYCFRMYIQDYGQKIMKTNHIRIRAKENASTFRQLQIMCLEYRMIYSRHMIGVKTAGILIIQTICLYNSIQMAIGRNAAGDSLEYNLLYSWIAFVCSLDVIFANGIFANVYTESNKTQIKLNRKLSLKINKWFMIWLRSCPVLKIYFGTTNYFDQFTPLTLFSFVITHVTNMLLLKE